MITEEIDLQDYKSLRGHSKEGYHELNLGRSGKLSRVGRTGAQAETVRLHAKASSYFLSIVSLPVPQSGYLSKGKNFKFLFLREI